MTVSQNMNCDRCPLKLGRRRFLAGAGASALALKAGVLDFTASLFADQPQPGRKPVVHAVFVRPRDKKDYWMTFTGPGFDVERHQADATKVMTDAARQLGVQLVVRPEPLSSEAEADVFLKECERTPPDGFIMVLMCRPWWRVVNHFVQKRGEVPTIMFAPVGTAFTQQHAATRHSPRTFQAATDDYGWLALGMRMLWTLGKMKDTRLLMFRGIKTEDKLLELIGTTLHYVPLARWMEEFHKAEATDEVRAIADYYTKQAQKVIEPKPEEILDAAKCYVVARKVMAEEACHGISVDCMRIVGKPDVPCGPCLAWSKLNDELIVGACETDWNAAITLLLTNLLFQRPGFMQDPVPNTVNGTLIGAHCSCPTKLNGPDKPHEPFLLRADNGSNRGVATQVLWRVGQEVTVLKFSGPGTMLLGTGRVASNIDTTYWGGCRTSVELEMDNVADSRDCKGFHQVFIYGKHDRPLRAFCQLAGIKVVPV